jgi:hypothetical protein
VPADQVVNAVPPRRGNPKPPKEPRTPRVVELLRKAIEWQALLESGEAANQADVARQHILSMPDEERRQGVRLAPAERRSKLEQRRQDLLKKLPEIGCQVRHRGAASRGRSTGGGLACSRVRLCRKRSRSYSTPAQDHDRPTIGRPTDLVEIRVFDVLQFPEFACPCSVRQLPGGVRGHAIGDGEYGHFLPACFEGGIFTDLKPEYTERFSV